MSEKPLQVRLEATNQLTGQYTLSFDSSHYAITLRPEINVTFSEWLRRLRPLLVGENDPAADIDPQDDLLRNVGTWLWKTLLPESAPPQEREALAHLLRTGQTPLLLNFPDVLAGLPWELFCDPEQSNENGFIALRRPLVRLSPSATVPTPIEPPLRVLLLISSPPVLGVDSRVDVESERAAVEHAMREMREAGHLHLMVEDIVTPKRVERLLDHFKPHIVHYVGHGEYNEESGGVLIWEDEQGSKLEFSASRLAQLLRERNLHAVVLHGCETAKGNGRAGVRSLAETLALEGLPAILAQQANFTYESSQLASRTWYQALIAGQSMASALLAVRQALIKADRPDWAVPILQGSTVSFTPLLDAPSSLPWSPDPLLTRQGAAADMAPPTEAFVGRHRELRALHLMLEEESNRGPVMALITGPGGMGKSTLMAQAVTRYGGSYKAVLLLRCQGYQSMDLFLQAIGECLKRLDSPSFSEQTLPDAKLRTEGKIEAAIVALNAAGPVLLVIDNLESVQDEDQMINDKALLYLLQKLLTNLRGGRVLITGRSMVKELLLQEDVGAKFLHLSLEDLSEYETHQLLLRYPTLAVLGEVVRQKLVREFGGLPYVYDLLSSRAASQDLEALIHDVQGRITAEHRRRTAEEWQEVRRQVVEFAALEVTLNHLPEASRVLLAQLSVLQQSFPLAAIVEGLKAEHAAWQSLLDWSLLHHDPYEKTYHLHSLTKRYAEGLLSEQSRTQVQAQLAVWYEHYADYESHKLADYLEAHRLWRTAGSLQQAGKLVAQLAETLSRFGLYVLLRDLYTMTLNDTYKTNEQMAAAALHGLGNLASAQGKYKEACSLRQQSLDIFERLGDQRGQASALHALGASAQDQGEYEKARDLSWRSMKLFEQLGDRRGQASSFGQLGIIAQSQGKLEEARSLYRQSLGIFEQLGDQRRQAMTLYHLGMIAQVQGEYEEAYSFYQYNLEIFERLGDQRGLAATLYQLGAIAFLQGRYEEAQSLHQQSLTINERLRDQKGQATTLHQLGTIAYSRGEYKEARDLYQLSLGISERLGDQREQANCQYQLGLVAHNQGMCEEARALLLQSLNVFEKLGDQHGLAAAKSALAMIDRGQGEYNEALGLIKQSLQTFERLGDQRVLAGCLHQLGNIAYLQKEYDKAYSSYRKSLKISERLGNLNGQANSLGQLGNIAYSRGEYDKAQNLCRKSQEISQRLGDQHGQANCLHQLGLIAQVQGKYKEAQSLYQQSLEISERLGDQDGRANSIGQLGALAYEQGNIEKALMYTVHAYTTLDTLRSPSLTTAQRMITRIRGQMGEETFMKHWRTLVGERPPIAAVKQEEAEDSQSVNVQELPKFVSSTILRGTVEQRQQLVADLAAAQQQLSSADAPLGLFLKCLAAVLRGEMPEVALLEPPFTELWHEFQECLYVLSNESNQQEQVNDD